MTGVQTCALPICIESNSEVNIPGTNNPTGDLQLRNYYGNVQVVHGNGISTLFGNGNVSFNSSINLNQGNLTFPDTTVQTTAYPGIVGVPTLTAASASQMSLSNTATINLTVSAQSIVVLITGSETGGVGGNAVASVSSLSGLGLSWFQRDRKSTRLNSSHIPLSRMPSSA